MLRLRDKLLRETASFRHGVVLPPQVVKRTFADVPMFNVAVPTRADSPWVSASGGAGWDEETATLAAIGEALERYAATMFSYDLGKQAPNALRLRDFSLFSETQLNRPGFPYRAVYETEHELTEVFSAYDNRSTWAPIPLIRLEQTPNGISTSSGLAVAHTPLQALLRAVEELLERDALVTTWLHSLKGRQVPMEGKYTRLVAKLGGQVSLLDATQKWNPHPVAIVAGGLPLRNRMRYSLGAACRRHWADAVDKAFLEWAQGVAFAGYHYAFHPDLQFKSFDDVRTFDDHAVFYTVQPRLWERLPLLKGALHQPPPEVPPLNDTDALRTLLERLQQEKIRVYYKEVTTPDLRQAGVACVKALSPDLTPICFDQRALYLGGRTSDIRWRYDAEPGAYPNPYPHPLG